ncbi:sulfatase family protein [Paenibacillus aestuarii]|uniref:Sulfatase n=1 Tax=Paenibacillus aestuarii TaxID=516965 RepID=A0ABW0KED7_9BACL|nr:sulfatase-like hydrolase/transferase [Paenibacillus aestuarii]
MNERKMNIILLMTDQHRLDHVSYHGYGRMSTPNIDRIAESVGFTNCVSVNPVCTPARAALLTGKYTHQIGMVAMSGDLSLQHPTYPRALQAHGYKTYGIGKFHWLQGWKFGSPIGKGHPLIEIKNDIRQFGFDEVWEVSGKQLVSRNYCDYAEHLDRQGLLEEYRKFNDRNTKNTNDAETQRFTAESFPFGEHNYMDIVIGNKIVEAIERRPKESPFFLFGSFVGPHPPYDPPQSYLDRVPYEEIDDFLPGPKGPLSKETKKHLYKLRQAYKAMITIIDEQVGRILTKLEEEGILDDTVLLFTADHGEMMGDHGRAQKQSPYHASAIVPAAIRHPSYLHGERNSAPMELTDFTATILDLAGLDPTEALSKDWPAFHDRVPCRSLLPIVAGKVERVRDYAFSECQGQWQMIQSERWKYVRHLQYEDPDKVPEQLYDLMNDPDELHNLIDHPAYSDAAEWCRKRRDFVLDQTPAAQLRWAPVIGE